MQLPGRISGASKTNQSETATHATEKPEARTQADYTKKLEKELIRLQRRVFLTEKLEQLLKLKLGFGEVLARSLDIALTSFNFGMGGLYLFEQNTEDLVLIVQNNLNQALPARIPEHKSENKRLLATRFQMSPVLSAVLPSNDVLLNKFVRSNALKSLIMIALQSQEKLWGLVCLASDRPLTIPLQEIDSLALLGNFLGLQIENFRLHNNLEEMINRHNLLLNNTLAGIFILQDRKFIYVNDRFARIHGYTPDEILQLDIGKLEWPLDLQSTRGQNIEIKRKATGDLHYECRGVHKNSKIVWLEMKAAFVEYQGKPSILGNVIDITDQKQFALELDNFQRQYRILLEGEREAILLAYPQHRIQNNAPNWTPETATQPSSPALQLGNKAGEVESDNEWVFEFFKRDTVGVMSLIQYHEMLNQSERSNMIFFQQNGYTALLGVLRSPSESPYLERLFVNMSPSMRRVIEQLPISLMFFDPDLNFSWANKVARLQQTWSSHQNDLKCAATYPGCKNSNPADALGCQSCILKLALLKNQPIHTSKIINPQHLQTDTVVPIRDQSNRVNGLLVITQTVALNEVCLSTSRLPEQCQLVENANAILDSATDAIIATDQTGAIIFLNSTAEKLFKFQMEATVTASLPELMASQPEAHRKIFQRMLVAKDEAQTAKLPDRIEIEMGQPDNTRISMEWSFSEARLQDKRIIFAFGRDISRHKQMEAELTLKNDFLENIIKFNPYGVEVFNTRGHIVHNNAAADLIYGFKRLVDYCIFDDLALEEAQVLDQIQDAFAGKIVTIGPFWYDTAKSGYDGIQPKKVCVRISFSPIRSKDGKILNVVAIHEDATPSKQIENELIASERRYREVVETALDGIFRVDASGVFSFVNPMMVEITGFSMEELIGKPFREIIPEQGLTHLTKLFDVSLKGANTYKDELVIKRKDGRESAIEISVVPISKAGNVTEIQAICRDITDRKKAEQSLRESRELYTALVEQSNDGVVLIRADSRLMFVNDGLCQLLKYKRNELLDHKFYKFLTRESRRRLFQTVRHQKADVSVPSTMELQILKKDGTSLVVETAVKQVKIHQHPIDMVHIRDVSERRKAAERIQTLSTAVESSEDGVFITDVTHNRFFVNNALAQMFGYSQEEMLVIPVEKLYTEPSHKLLNETIFPGVYSAKNWTGELEAVRKSGEIFPILLTISPIFNDEETQIGTVGISKDITERKNIEEELRKKNQFLEKIIDLNPYGVQILDSEGRSVRVNKAFEKMFKPVLAVADMVNVPLLKCNEFQKLLQMTYDGQVVSVSPFWVNLKELDEKIKENTLLGLGVVLFPILDEKKKVANVVGLYEDITEREQSREEIERHNRELTALYDAGQAMVSIREPQVLITSILKGATMAAGTEFGAYFSYTRDANIFELSTTIGFSAQHLELIHQKFQHTHPDTTETIFWYGSQQNILTPADMKKATELMSPEKIFLSALWVPVMYEARLLGVFNLFSKTPDAFGEASIRLVTMFADQAAVALENARLYSELTKIAEEMEIKIAERTRELSESEVKYRSIVENSPDLISIEDLESRTLFGNTAFYSKLGYSPDEATQIDSFSLIHPDDLRTAKEQFENLRNGMAIRNLECRYRNKDKSWLYLLISGEKLKLGDKEVIQLVARDITEKKELEINLKKSEVHHRALIDNVRDGVYTIKNNKIVWCNAQLAEIFGYDSSEILGAYMAKLFTDQSTFLTYEQELYFALAENGHYRSEINGRRKNGETFNLECSVSLIEQNSENESEALVIARDITERKRMQEKLIQSERLAATGKLAASIAHEINNPLQGIMTSIAAVRLRLKDIACDLSGLDIVETGLKRISNIVKQLLSLHRPERQEKHWSNINQIVEEVISLMQSQLMMHQIAIKKSLSDTLPQVYISSQQIHQVLLNLMLNGQESMADGGEIRVVTRHKNNNIIVKIIDTGKGIDPQDLPKIFDPFFSTKDKMGTGLGLSVVHSAIESHGGRIEVNSTLGKGAEFTIYLPVKNKD
ncbi:PAS domain S-box protein [candidate division KSB1 bacterium]|nr:PAS domain S-box protein [candidate division KSB1 bacterium]